MSPREKGETPDAERPSHTTVSIPETGAHAFAPLKRRAATRENPRGRAGRRRMSKNEHPLFVPLPSSRLRQVDLPQTVRNHLTPQRVAWSDRGPAGQGPLLVYAQRGLKV